MQAPTITENSLAYTVYLLKCKDGSIYTGIAKNLQQRIQKHLQGKASKYTRSKLPIRCIYSESQTNLSAAMRREHAIKRLSHQQKLALARGRARI